MSPDRIGEIVKCSRLLGRNEYGDIVEVPNDGVCALDESCKRAQSARAACPLVDEEGVYSTVGIVSSNGELLEVCQATVTVFREGKTALKVVR